MTSSRSFSPRSLLLGMVVTIATVAVGGHLGTVLASTTPPTRIDAAASADKQAKRMNLAPGLDGTTPNANGLIFPMATKPVCNILSNFGDPRPGGRTHQAIDILATLGQPVYAVTDGKITEKVIDGGINSVLSGNMLRLTLPDKTYYVYAHLSAFAAGIAVGTSVRQGDVIGYVGDTGDPGAGNYHLHFEVHPLGGAAINPLKVLTVPASCNLW